MPWEEGPVELDRWELAFLKKRTFKYPNRTSLRRAMYRHGGYMGKKKVGRPTSEYLLEKDRRHNEFLKYGGIGAYVYVESEKIEKPPREYKAKARNPLYFNSRKAAFDLLKCDCGAAWALTKGAHELSCNVYCSYNPELEARDNV
jgi:hypothetical protein